MVMNIPNYPSTWGAPSAPIQVGQSLGYIETESGPAKIEVISMTREALDDPGALIFVAGVDEAEAVVQAQAALTSLEVNEATLPVVTDLGNVIVEPVVFQPDELYMPQDVLDAGMYMLNGVGVADADLLFIMGGGSTVPIQSAALASMWVTILAFIVWVGVEVFMDWLHDQIGGGESNAIYFRQRLIGYADGAVRRGPSGSYGIYGRSTNG